jgi:DNA modification methylase
MTIEQRRAMTPLGQWELDTVYNVDALELLRGLPDGSVNCAVTSPPYFGLRSYLDGDARELGKEDKPDDYIARLVEIFRELRRALRDDGVFWLNLGDTYSNAGKWGGNTGYDTKQQTNVGSIRRTSRNAVDIGAKEKELLMIPARVALALQADGWYLRAEVIWDKGNPMPESVQDRPTRAHEYVYMLTKRPHYYYNADAIKTPVQKQSIKRQGRAVSATHKNHAGGPGQTPHSMFRARKNNKQDGVGSRRYADFNERYEANTTPMANARSVWRIHPKGFKGAHYATFPAELVERCLLAGCPKGGIVLDMFFGAGTTGRVAERLGLRWLGADINPEYVALSTARIAGRFEEYQARKEGKATTAYMFAEEILP